ncbi:hypothetical protein A3742_15325 [Oleiphilus sp. HI0071]|nr:sensor histidine kinase [Oleiphilus sp. HI0080]KZY60146.1 hypothetical protein A3737_06945 [Oleiphilus sp. HI0065]KZY78024.1 hypothetical protein A3742_15325 [Oleiphilus sp. HI0071]KZY90115.1 hypothetical protein A3744_05710 [Oleiphilus sp. HI0073]KZZ50330.1 hypothetical protein A3760_02230 [Oleiphilus sp. HI0122]KZZ18728.1 hypothetical protein A3751_00985 [Oleiphilus sp. HI0080]
MSKPAKTRSLASELLIQLAIVALVPLGATMAFFTWQLFPYLTKNIIDEQQSIASLVTQQVIERIATAEEQAGLLIGLAAQDIDRRELVKGFLSQKSDFDSVYFLDATGSIKSIAIRDAIVLETEQLYMDMDLSHSSVYQTEGKTSGWTQVFLSIVTGRLSIAYFEEVGEQRLIAELAIDRLPKLSKRLSEQDILMMLVDADHQLIAHPDSSLSQQQFNLGHLALFNRPDSQKVYSTDFEWDNQKYFGTLVTMDDLGWSVIVSEEESSIWAGLYQQLRNWLISVVTIIVLVLLIALKRSSLFSRRFAVLSQQAKDIARGNYQTEVVQERIREFNELSENVVEMSQAISNREDALQTKEQQLREINEMLEERVEERTKRLIESNQELEKTNTALNDTMDQLVQADKLASLGSLVAGVAHELNTPIGNATMASSTLKDFAERIQQQLATGSVTKSGLKEFLNDAIMAAGITSRNLEKASELITSFKQVATDQSSSQRRTFSLNELFHEILLTLHPQTKKKAIKIELDVASEISLDSYPGPLGQVLSNLIMNAFIHGFEDRMQGRIRISAMKEEDKVQITLEDDGKGIPETALPKIFDPFYTTRLGQGGSGLGLHICHNIVVDTLAGKIRAESEVGQGTRFLLTLAACAPRLEEV